MSLPRTSHILPHMLPRESLQMLMPQIHMDSYEEKDVSTYCGWPQKPTISAKIHTHTHAHTHARTVSLGRTRAGYDTQRWQLCSKSQEDSHNQVPFWADWHPKVSHVVRTGDSRNFHLCKKGRHTATWPLEDNSVLWKGWVYDHKGVLFIHLLTEHLLIPPWALLWDLGPSRKTDWVFWSR